MLSHFSEQFQGVQGPFQQHIVTFQGFQDWFLPNFRVMVNMTVPSFSSFNDLLGDWSIPVHVVLFRFIHSTFYFQVHLRLRHIPLISGTLVKQDTITNPLSQGTYCSEMFQNEWFWKIVDEYFHHDWEKCWALLLWSAPEQRISNDCWGILSPWLKKIWSYCSY